MKTDPVLCVFFSFFFLVCEMHTITFDQVTIISIVDTYLIKCIFRSELIGRAHAPLVYNMVRGIGIHNTLELFV